MARQEEKQKRREAAVKAREDGDNESMGSSQIVGSEKSGAKKTPADGKSVQSPHTQSEAEGKSKTASERQSLGKDMGSEEEGSDEHGEDMDDEPGSEEDPADLPSQNEMKRELIAAIEEEMRE